jgi:thymidylate synthase ThyX
VNTPKVTLVTHTANPLETVYVVWEASKAENRLMTVDEVKRNVPPEEVRKLFRAVLAQRIPIGEHCDFVFMIENVSVSWREQAVRHRIGTHISPERLGIDIIPDLASSSWWSQSMRIQDMGHFADNKAYRVPETLDGKEVAPGIPASSLFKDTMDLVQDAYNALVAAGVPMEDARELIPLGAQHRISWKLNIASLQHIVGKRGCWILQLGIWGPVIQGMIEELATKVDPIFRELVTPPCLEANSDEFHGCKFHEENRRRYTGDDKLPPCPLHFRNHHLPERSAIGAEIAAAETPVIQAKFKLPMADEMNRRARDYAQFWGRHPFTGKRLEG